MENKVKTSSTTEDKGTGAENWTTGAVPESTPAGEDEPVPDYGDQGPEMSGSTV